jgi:hypothetical protein
LDLLAAELVGVDHPPERIGRRRLGSPDLVSSPGVEPRGTGILGMEGVDTRQGDQQQSNAQRHRRHGHDQPDGSFFPTVEGQA